MVALQADVAATLRKLAPDSPVSIIAAGSAAPRTVVSSWTTGVSAVWGRSTSTKATAGLTVPCVRYSTQSPPGPRAMRTLTRSPWVSFGSPGRGPFWSSPGSWSSVGRPILVQSVSVP